MTKIEKAVVWFLSGLIFLGLGYAWRMHQEKQWVNREIAEIREVLRESEIALAEHEKVLRGYKILVTQMEVDRQREKRGK